MARRGPGEGGLYQRTIGGHTYWVAQSPRDEETGRRRSFYGKTRALVLTKLTSYRRARERNALAPEDLTLADYLAGWLVEDVQTTRRARVATDYAAIVRTYLVPRLGSVKLAKLGPRHVQQLQADLRAEGKAPQTIRNVRNVLSAALRYAVEGEMLADNPVRKVRGPKGRKSRRRTLTREQSWTLVEHLQGDRLEALFLVALALGLRRGEALGLHWADIDEDAGTITVQRQLQRVPGRGLIYEELKPGADEDQRVVVLPRAAATKLHEHRARQQTERDARLERGKPWPNTDRHGREVLVFTTPTGTPLDPRNVQTRWTELRTAAGLDDWKLHELRHSYASLLLAEKIPAHVVRESMGHSARSRTLEEFYAHATPEALREAAEAMDAILRGPPR